MAQETTINDHAQSLNAHVAAKGGEIRAKYGPHIGWEELLKVLEDRSAVRYPCEIVFDAGPLLEGEVAHPVANGDAPADGFKIHVHPHFRGELSSAACAVLYQLVVVNYGPFASADDAETFGSIVLGLSKDEYYERLCGMADALGGLPATGRPT